MPPNAAPKSDATQRCTSKAMSVNRLSTIVSRMEGWHDLKWRLLPSTTYRLLRLIGPVSCVLNIPPGASCHMQRPTCRTTYIVVQFAKGQLHMHSVACIAQDASLCQLSPKWNPMPCPKHARPPSTRRARRLVARVLSFLHPPSSQPFPRRILFTPTCRFDAPIDTFFVPSRSGRRSRIPDRDLRRCRDVVGISRRHRRWKAAFGVVFCAL